jgi:hypothetical protein
MDSPLDAFSSESSADAPVRHTTNAPRGARPGFRNTRRTTLVNRLRRRLIDAVDWVAEKTVTLAALARTPRRWIVTARWRRRPIHRPAWASNERIAVIATAAITSAAVSQFTLWMGSERLPGNDAPMTVVAVPTGRAEAPVALEAAADRVSVGFGRVAAPVAPQRPVATTPTPTAQTPIPAVRTPPPPASSPLPLAQDNGAPQDAMLLQDRPVLMDARLVVGTAGSTPLRPAAVASPATDRDSAASAISPPPTSRENTIVDRPAASRAGLVVITQPEGARVTINGVGWGMTPLTIGHLPPGAKRVRITKPGYRSEERVVATDPDRPAATLRIALSEAAEVRPHQ